MSNPPKKKGTGGEREVLQSCLARGLDAKRTPASARYDIEVRGSTGRVIEALAIRPDKDEWLVAIRLQDFLHILQEHGDTAHIECKRYARSALHTIWKRKFGDPHVLDV